VGAALVRLDDNEDTTKVMTEALRKVIKRMHYPLEVMLTCVRWYVAYPFEPAPYRGDDGRARRVR
jgi:hypothetical protein